MIKMGSKSIKNMLSMQDILIMLFGRGGGGPGGSQPFWSHFSFKSFPITPYKKYLPLLYYHIMKNNFKTFFRSQSQSAVAAVKILILKENKFIQGVFKGKKNSVNYQKLGKF